MLPRIQNLIIIVQMMETRQIWLQVAFPRILYNRSQRKSLGARATTSEAVTTTTIVTIPIVATIGQTAVDHVAETNIELIGAPHNFLFCWYSSTTIPFHSRYYYHYCNNLESTITLSSGT